MKGVDIMLNFYNLAKQYETYSTTTLNNMYAELKDEIAKLYHQLYLAAEANEDFGLINQQIIEKTEYTTAIEFILNQRGF